MAADGGPQGWRAIAWEGSTVTARADAWIVVTGREDRVLEVPAGWTTRPLGHDCHAVVAPGATPERVAAWAASVSVASVEPDRRISRSAVPDDPSFGRLWGLHNTGQNGGRVDDDIDAVEAWDVTTGSRSVVVAVIDTGMDYRHVDLAANVWTNPGEISGDGLDNDGNGFVDDVHGWDFANGDADPFDDDGHGTHVAGTIGAVGGNGLGVTGVAWTTALMPLKFLDGAGNGATSDAIAAINYATRMRREFGVNVVVANNSWGGAEASTALRTAISAGEAAGIVSVAAAGNESTSNDAVAAYPANYATLSVAATDAQNRLAGFSNWGLKTVAIAAPGVGVYSTLPGNTYGSDSGTSMATAYVSGVVALLASAHPGSSVSAIRAAIVSSTTPVAGLSSKVASGGVVNAPAALAALSRAVKPLDPEDPPPAPPVEMDVVDVAPDPRTGAVSSVEVHFSRPVAGVAAASITLTRDDVPVPLQGLRLTSSDGVRWTLDGLAEETALAGTYVLRVAADRGIVAVDDGATPLAAATDTWLMRPAAVDPGDTLARAAVVSMGGGEVRITGRIGDGSAGRRDVDLFRVALATGQHLIVDVDARTLPGGSTLDSYVRVFTATGRQLTANDDAAGSPDSFVNFRAALTGIYYIGISGFGNRGYRPAVAASGTPGSTGGYRVLFAVATPAGAGSRLSAARTSSMAVVQAAFAACGAGGGQTVAPAAAARTRRVVLAGGY